MQLASRFASRYPVLRADHPLSDDQISAVAPTQNVRLNRAMWLLADGMQRLKA